MVDSYGDGWNGNTWSWWVWFHTIVFGFSTSTEYTYVLTCTPTYLPTHATRD